MRVSINLTTAGGTLTIAKEEGDQRAKGGGWATDGWGAENHLIYMIKKRLGWGLVNVRISKDGHLFGDDAMVYLRPPRRGNKGVPHIYIYHDRYAIDSASELYNSGQEVDYAIVGDVFGKQPEWAAMVKGLCAASKVTVRQR